MRRIVIRSILIVGLGVSASRPVLADDVGARARALGLSRRASDAYAQGDFARAAALLEKAHALFPEPTLEYNLGRSLEGAGEPARAIEAYRAYLAEAHDIPDRPVIERRIRALERELADARRARVAEARAAALQAELARRASEPPNPPDDHRADHGVAPWLIGGAGVALVATGAGFGIMARNRHQDAVDDPVQRSAAEQQHQAERLSWLAVGCYTAGSLAIATGITWLLIEHRSHDHEPARAATLELGLAPTGAFVRGAF